MGGIGPKMAKRSCADGVNRDSPITRTGCAYRALDGKCAELLEAAGVDTVKELVR
jgi:hypothetical protein